MPSRTTIHARAAAVTGAAVNRRGSARARAALAVSVVAAAAVGTALAGAGPAAAYPVVTLYAARPPPAPGTAPPPRTRAP